MSGSCPIAAHAFTGFYQLAYVTTDLDRAVERLAEQFSVDGFETFEVGLELDDGGRTDIRGGLAFVGALQLEVVEPGGGRDDIYRAAPPGA